MLLEQSVRARFHRSTDRLDDLEVEHKTAEQVGHRQRVAARTIPGLEPALEVDRPAVVRPHDRRKGLIHRQQAAPAAARLAQTLAPEQIRYRAR
jgi:hypothetical protein